TGFIDRHLILVVEAYDDAGQSVSASRGPLLPPLVGPELAGRSGKLFAKRLKNENDESPVPFWLAAQAEVIDTRLSPERVETNQFDFPKEAIRVRTRLLYRRFWSEVARAKGWPAAEVGVFDRERKSGTGQ
ncbi:MAG: hypothetical protein AB7K24_27170, partial [Gemmataceae bacterium]